MEEKKEEMITKGEKIATVYQLACFFFFISLLLDRTRRLITFAYGGCRVCHLIVVLVVLAASAYDYISSTFFFARWNRPFSFLNLNDQCVLRVVCLVRPINAIFNGKRRLSI